jgi:hypothetical protein
VKGGGGARGLFHEVPQGARILPYATVLLGTLSALIASSDRSDALPRFLYYSIMNM